MDSQTASTIQTLQQIWQRVFQRSPIAADDDFFDLGGDAWLAAELFSHINQEFGRQLSPAILCNAPTIAVLAAALDSPAQSGPAVQLSKSANSVPVFMFHGIGSSVIDLVPLVRRMQSGRSVYGLETKGNEGRHEPFDRVESIAGFFLPAIRQIQPHGPYSLIGYSFGGLIALEIARHFKAEAENIGLLVMIDSYPDRLYLSFAQYARLLWQLARDRLRNPPNSDANQKRRLVARSDFERNSLVQALERVKAAQYRALHSYRPHSYDGTLKFVRASQPTRFPANPVPVWSPLVRTLEVETVPGAHLDLLTTSVDQLASMLDRYVRGAGR